jgi:uncharacterized protein YdhG (YjbR/CyaY superfamily)
VSESSTLSCPLLPVSRRPPEPRTPVVSSRATTVEQYLAELPPHRRPAIETLRETVRAHVPPGVEERMNWGMISYEVPLSRYPDTYNGQPLMYAAIAAQKNHYAVYLTSVYMDARLEKRLRDGFAAAGKKLDMGKSCIRFRNLEAVPLGVIGEIAGACTLDDYLSTYEESRRR